MTTYNPPTDTELNTNKPNKYSLFRRIRDMAIAITEGASGAPRIQGTAILAGAITPSHFANVSAGNYRDGAGTRVLTTTSATYVKVGEISMPRAGTVRTRLALTWSGIDFESGTAYARLYKNGAAVGTERSTGSSCGGTPCSSTGTWTEDLSVAAGDLLQLYMKRVTAGTALGELAGYAANPLTPGDLI